MRGGKDASVPVPGLYRADVRLALEAGFTPEEVTYMLALDIEAVNLEWSVDGSGQADGSSPERLKAAAA